jgi:hypothetical protein
MLTRRAVFMMPLAVAARDETVELFHQGDAGVHTYRIPALIETRKGTLLAVCDARHDSSGDMPARISLVMRRSHDRGHRARRKVVDLYQCCQYEARKSHSESQLGLGQDVDREASAARGPSGLFHSDRDARWEPGRDVRMRREGGVRADCIRAGLSVKPGAKSCTRAIDKHADQAHISIRTKVTDVPAKIAGRK